MARRQDGNPADYSSLTTPADRPSPQYMMAMLDAMATSYDGSGRTPRVSSPIGGSAVGNNPFQQENSTMAPSAGDPQAAQMIQAILANQQQMRNQAAQNQLMINKNQRLGGITPSSIMPPVPSSTPSVSAQNQGFQQQQSAQDLAMLMATMSHNTPSSTIGGSPQGVARYGAGIAGNTPNSTNDPFDVNQSNTTVDSMRSSGLPVNESLLAGLLYKNPELAISMGGTAQYGTPGYFNLANMNFDPLNIYAASGQSVQPGTSPVDIFNYESNLYKTLGTVGSKGGGTVNAPVLLGNMLYADPSSDLGMQFANDATSFYTIGMDVLTASGATPLALASFKSTLGRMYTEYAQYQLTSDASNVQPFNTWIVQSHPEVAAGWTQGGDL